eukprot:2015142-Rhodomonas_salina.2
MPFLDWYPGTVTYQYYVLGRNSGVSPFPELGIPTCMTSIKSLQIALDSMGLVQSLFICTNLYQCKGAPTAAMPLAKQGGTMLTLVHSYSGVT